jgi:hypothetical protein
MLSCDPDDIQAKGDNQPRTKKHKRARIGPTKLPKRPKARLGTLKNTNMYRMKVSFTCRKEMEVREMKKTAVNITLVELGKLTFFWTTPPQTRGRCEFTHLRRYYDVKDRSYLP